MDWVCIISDDDYLENNHFSSLIDLVFNFPKSYFACNHTKIFYQNNFTKSPSMKFPKWKRSSFYNPSIKIMWDMYFNHFVSTGCIFKTSILKKIYYDENCDDRIFLSELSSLFPFCTSQKSTAVLTISSNTFSARGGARSDLNFKSLFKSFFRKIDQALILHDKGNKKALNNLIFIYINEYFISALRLIISKNTKLIFQNSLLN